MARGRTPAGRGLSSRWPQPFQGRRTGRGRKDDRASGNCCSHPNLPSLKGVGIGVKLNGKRSSVLILKFVCFYFVDFIGKTAL